jgi:hypothetical protein
MSRVFFAEETRLARQVVIKVLPPEMGAGAGELYEAKGNRQKAVERYSRFVELWRNADPELQPGVREIRERVARLAKEPGA